MQPDILTRGLTADGHAVTKNGTVLMWFDRSTRETMQYDTATGQLTVSGRRTTTADNAAANVKQSFSRELVRTQAAKYGWQVKQTGNTFQVVKGYQ